MTTATRLDELRGRLVGRDLAGTTIVDPRAELSETLDGEELTRVWLLIPPPNTFVRFSAEGDEDLEGVQG